MTLSVWICCSYKRAKDEGKDDALSRKQMQEDNDRIANMSEEELILNTNGIDWDTIARSYVCLSFHSRLPIFSASFPLLCCMRVAQVRSRSGIDCMIRWMGNDDPRINNGGWSRDEDKRLLQLAEEFHQRNWVEIAQRLNVSAAH